MVGSVEVRTLLGGSGTYTIRISDGSGGHEIPQDMGVCAPSENSEP